jgi:hypothetical protein
MESINIWREGYAIEFQLVGVKRKIHHKDVYIYVLVFAMAHKTDPY